MQLKVIWKFPLEIEDEQVIRIPDDHKILCIQIQSGVPTIWAAVAKDGDLRETTIRCYGTGHSFKENRGDLYIGTVQADGFVWHFFEEVYLALQGS